MKRHCFLLLLCSTLAALVPCAASAEGTESRLISVLSCESHASPSDVSGLIHSLGGHSLMSESAFTDVEYTLPNPIHVFGQPITVVSIHTGSNADGDFTEYRSLFSGPAQTVARYAGIATDDGMYKRQVGNDDILMRFEPGGSYIVCAQGVRSTTKWIKRKYRSMNESKIGL